MYYEIVGLPQELGADSVTKTLQGIGWKTSPVRSTTKGGLSIWTVTAEKPPTTLMFYVANKEVVIREQMAGTRTRPSVTVYALPRGEGRRRCCWDGEDLG